MASGSGSGRVVGRAQVVATHMDAPAKGLYPLPFVEDLDSPMAASFRVLRYRLREADELQVLAVTSPGPGEGKTTCAINLAMALAEHGRDRVLLVEANVRSPKIGVALGFMPPLCFTRQMSQHLDEPSAPWRVVAAFYDNLHVLPVDPSQLQGKLLSPPAIKVAIEQLRQADYKYIVVDCPPVLGSADVNVIEDLVDEVLLVAKVGGTTREQLLAAADHIAPAEFLGTVLMHAL
ncbi:MAG TPA: hypothetical protein ENK23_06980 [Sorangium sp.]|nr:hypothetical protein [Sorangium sp.]